MDGFPSCALDCLMQALPSSSCSPSDFDCICLDNQLIAKIQACALQNCSVKDGLLATRFLYETCDYPVTVDHQMSLPLFIAGTIFSTLAVILRIAARLIGSKLGFDDGAILLAFLLTSQAATLPYSALCIIEHNIGIGTDIWFLPFDTITEIIYVFYIGEILYVAIMALSKTSMLLLLIRLFPFHFRVTIYLMMAFTMAWGVAILFALIFSCQPVSHFWHMWDGEHQGKCIDHPRMIWAHAIINILLDVVMIGLPVPTVIKMNISRRKKVGICSIFAVGIVVTIVSIIRLVKSLSFNMNDNPTKKFVEVGMWSGIEVYLSIICACMPGIRALFKYTHARLWPNAPSFANLPSESLQDSNGISNDIRNGKGDINIVRRSLDVLSGTLKSANREQAEFIRLQERDANTGDL
ncbi:hypothetical protein BJX99DRAFT_243126 [Aspergillus californicus]